MKKLICCLFCCFSLFQSAVWADTTGINVNAKSCVLMEQTSGEILYENAPDERLPIASVTKIMTMLLIMEDIDDGKITIEDMVPVSERAMSMGGSTMFLETGEQLSVHDMLKGIAVASANDGAVAMAEFLSGSVEAFVERMNARAKELGMENTNFVNTNGLDDDNHYSSAKDVAIMSRELLKHEKIFDYTTIWTDELRGGKFQLANTNKLIRFYDGANGLKTGSTSKALCCLSASAKRGDMQLIAVVLGAPTSKERFDGARTLLDYGFSAYTVSRQGEKDEAIGEATVKKGVSEKVNAVLKESCEYLMKKGEDKNIEKIITINENITAPVLQGDVIGNVEFKSGDKTIGSEELIAENDVNKKGLSSMLKDILYGIFV